VQWSPDSDNIVWATAMPGSSNSTPVITGDRLFVCAEPTTLVCVRASDGKILWQRDHSTKQLIPPVDEPLPSAHRTNGYSSSTPVTDGEHVYAVFGNGVIACYDLNGRRRWITRTGASSHKWGHSSSPALAGATLAVLFEDLVGLNAKTGRVQWRAPSRQRWGSPIATRIDQTDVFVTPNGEIVDAGDGRVLFKGAGSLEWCSPVVADGVLYQIERVASATKLPEKIDASDKPRELWVARIKHDRYYSSPLIHDGLIYAVTRGEVLTVLDARASGAKVYERRLDLEGPKPNSAYSSVTLAGPYIYIGSQSGITLVIEPGREYRQVARNRLEPYRSTPVFVGRRMYLRGLEHLYCIESTDKR
jgi:outer membrane protein assembly factor BamB